MVMQVFTTVTDSYQHSAELRLFLSLFKKALPDGAGLTIINRGSRLASVVLKEALANWIAARMSSEVDSILVVREPSLFVGAGAVQELKNVLDADSRLACVLPIDFRDQHNGCQPSYLTLRGFERFVDVSRNQGQGVFPFDGRQVFMFLLRAADLLTMDLPEDIFSLPGMWREKAFMVPGAYIHPLFDYYFEERKDVLSLVPENVASVLDIGCTRGGFGQALKRERSCRVVGIEMNRDEGEKARSVLDEVVIGDALEVEISERFDCVTCLDVLEHFVTPERLLARIRDDFLQPVTGRLLLSIPNVGHWSVVEDLLAGRWDYLPVGLLCTTHMRFFTRKTIVDLLMDNGFVVEKIEGVSIPMPDSLKAGFVSLSGNHALDIDGPGLETLHYNILARREG